MGQGKGWSEYGNIRGEIANIERKEDLLRFTQRHGQRVWNISVDIPQNQIQWKTIMMPIPAKQPRNITDCQSQSHSNVHLEEWVKLDKTIF